MEYAAPVWGGAKKAAFRLAFLYFALFALTTQILGGLLPLPQLEFDPAVWAPVRVPIQWTALHLFRVQKPLVYTGSGSGDKTFDWVMVFCELVLAAAGAALWSALDRRRPNYASLYRWFHLGLRFVLGSEMVLYGMVKAVPLQMPFPFLARLVEPFGNFSPMGVLWASVGASPAYERFTGCAELLAGILLFIPRTSLAGALVALLDASYIFTLNMTYDVPVKLFSFQLIAMALLLLGPDLGRLARVLFAEGPVGPSRLPRWTRRAIAAQAIYGLLLLAGNAHGAWKSWHQFGGGAPKSELYGIWNVATPGDFRRVIFDRPGNVALQRTIDDAFSYFSAKIDSAAATIAIDAKEQWHFTRPSPDALHLEGTLNAKPISWDLKLLDPSRLMLVSRGFHWIQEYPFNR